MTKILLLCAILAALCGSANAQYSDPYGQSFGWTPSDDQSWHSREQDYQLQDMQRQLDQQREDAQRDHEMMEDRLRAQQLLDNFGCDIHNHCR